MSGWDVTVSLISGLQLQLNLRAHERYSKIIAQVRRRWGIPDRCQKLVWNGDILRKDELGDLGPLNSQAPATCPTCVHSWRIAIVWPCAICDEPLGCHDG